MLREQALLSRSRLINVLRIDLAYHQHTHSMSSWSKVKKMNANSPYEVDMILDYGSWIVRRAMGFKRDVHTCHVLDMPKAQGLGTHGFCFRSKLMSENSNFDDFHEVSRQWEGC